VDLRQRPAHNRPVLRLDTLAIVTVMAGSLVFHYVYCLLPSLRYFNARGGAYVLGAAAYGLVAIPPIIGALGLDLSAETILPSFVVTIVVLTIAAWRPYAFVRASGGPRPQPLQDRSAAASDPSQVGEAPSDIPAR
jgi:hypothetical protein